MTREILTQANTLTVQIDSVTSQLRQVEQMLDETKEPKVRTRVRGMDFELPKAVFKGELQKQKRDLETELTDLNSQFDAL